MHYNRGQSKWRYILNNSWYAFRIELEIGNLFIEQTVAAEDANKVGGGARRVKMDLRELSPEVHQI